MKQEQVLARLVEGVRQMVQVDAVEIRLLDEEGARLAVAVWADAAGTHWPREPNEVADSTLDREALSGHPVIIADTHTDPRATDAPGDCRSVLCVPLVHEGLALGALRLCAAAPRRFDEVDAARLMPLADLGAAAIAATRALKTLESLEASKSQFIRVATHELRSPVTVAQSLMRGVLKGYAGELTDKQTEVFGRVSRRLDFLESLVNDLLDMAAGKTPELGEEKAPVLLNASVGRAVLLLQPRAEEKGLEMTLQPCPEPLIVWGTEEGLDRIFVNLIGNAVKYTPSGGTVTVAVRRTNGQAQVAVADTGIGIPEESLPHLFEEFYRAPNAKALAEVGTGLGLTIVKDLVERYGGHIEVESTIGEGTTFAVTFPIHRLAG